MRVSKEYKVGLLVVLGLLLVFVGSRFLSGGAMFGSDREFYAVFKNSRGLLPSNEVKLSGHKIGQVEEVGLYPEDPGLVLVKFSVADDALEIPVTAEAWITKDLLGTASIEIRLDTASTAQISYYQSGDTMISNVEKTIGERFNEFMAPFKKLNKKLIGPVDEIQ
jgi:phospholipid/cholesterol/gamma-HCH transport system substrate-binding protein